MKLTNRDEKLIISLRSSHGRRKSPLRLCEGVRACLELVTSAPELVRFAVRDESFTPEPPLDSLEFSVVSNAEFAKLAGTVSPQGVLLLVEPPPISGAFELCDPFAVVLDGVADPGNMGTVIRTMRAVGLRQLFLTDGSADPFSPKCVRSGMAAQFAMEIRKFASLADVVRELRGNGVGRFWRCDPHKGASLFEADDVFQNSVVILGSEASGSDELPGTEPLTLPMPGGYESINVAQAATVVLFDAVRRGVLSSS
ncbi:MAG: RNA methyltransferase [Victivallales bacterium]|nr:RNA methyltransferase [Victivallales bacterium]